MVTKTGVVYLQKDKLQLYSPFLSSIVEFRFVPEIVRDLDIVNKSLLENLIKTFITNGKIPVSNLVFILADNTYFVKDFVIPPPPAVQKGAVTPPPSSMTMEDLQEAADKYIEHVPYDSVVSKTFPMKNGLRVCAVNQEFYGHIRDAFEKIGFTVISILPGLVLGGNMSAKPIMDGGMAQFTLQKAGSFKLYDLLDQEVYVPVSEKAEENKEEVEFQEQKEKPNKKRLYVMIGIFAVLLIVLAILVWQMMAPPPPPKSQSTHMKPAAGPVDVKPASTNAATPVYTAMPSVTSAVLPTLGQSQDVKGIAVQIATSPKDASKAQMIKTDLGKYGFTSVNVQTTSGLESASTIISFSQDISQAVRNTVLAVVKKVTPAMSVQERENETGTISIILGE